MPNSLDYIAANNLPIDIYLDFTDASTSSISGSTFTQLNLVGDTRYDFISQGTPNHPQRGVRGVTFGSTRKLSPRSPNLLNEASSYSLLIVSKNSTNSLLKIGKNNPALPKLLEISYQDSNLEQKYSRLNVTDQELSLGELESTQVCLLSHNIITGHTDTSINLQEEFQRNTKLDTGALLNNFPSSFNLGEGFGGELLQFLLFSPAISNFHLLELGKRVSGYSPQSALKFDKLLLTTDSKLITVTSFLPKPTVKYNLPIKIKIANFDSKVEFSSELVLVASFSWDMLSESQWDATTETLWGAMS